jgi:hypothetical protein
MSHTRHFIVYILLNSVCNPHTHENPLFALLPDRPARRLQAR